MGEMKPTLGEWVVAPIDGNCYEVMCDSGYYIATCHDGVRSESNAEANARLIAEAGTVFHNTGLSPVQLVEQRDVMAQALRKIIEMNQQWASDQWGDVNKAESMACVREARAALAKCEGVD